MNTTDLVHFPHVEKPGRRAATRPAIAPSRHELVGAVRNSILCGREYLCGEQRLDGSWSGETTGEISALSQLVLLYAYLGREQEEIVAQAARGILRQQRVEGGWARTPGGTFDLDRSVQAYFALKLMGEDACGLELARARREIREHGGVDRCGESTRRWLALLGQIEYDLCTPTAPEYLLTSALNLSATSGELLDLAARSAVWALRPRRELEFARGIRELFIDRPRDWMPPPRCASCSADRLSRIWSRCERVGFVPLRRRALERASFLLTEAAIEPPYGEVDFEELAWRWVALKALGYRDSSRAVEASEQRVTRLIAVDDVADEARSQPTTALAIDTSLALEALGASGISRERAVMAAGIRWIADHREGCVGAGVSLAESSSLLRALTAIDRGCTADGAELPPELRVLDSEDEGHAAPPAGDAVPLETVRQFIDRLVSGLSVEQRPDGGWSVCDGIVRMRSKGINHACGRHAGSSAVDLTGTVLEGFSGGRICVRAVCERAIANLRSTQRGDGSWDSTTHSRYIYGTSCAIRGLIASGLVAEDPIIAAGVNWLLVHQNITGGWGEEGNHSENAVDSAVTDPTAIQTAWAVLALVAAGMADHDATLRGVDFLISCQDEQGGWRDARLVERNAGHGPWYQNNLHSTSWSLLALAKWATSISISVESFAPSLRLVCEESPH